MRILVTGASGLIGKNFIRHALLSGHDVVALVREPKRFKMLPKERIFRWTHDATVPAESLEKVDAIVHLAGENIAASRWTQARKTLLEDSRIEGTRGLVEAIARLAPEQRPKILVSSSAIGIYGYHRKEVVTEETTAGDDFLAQLCVAWEREALKAQALGLRVALARTGIVLSREGGALTKMPPVKVSDGSSWMSWIHIEDMVRVLSFALEHDELRGPFNCVSPGSVQNVDFTKILARLRGVPALGFAPAFALKLALGELSAVILSSLRIAPRTLLQAGFRFSYPDLAPALERELGGVKLTDGHFFQDQFVPLPPEQVFPFFSRAENLEELTPPWLNFRILKKTTPEIKQGTLIDYKLKIHGAPVRWRTLISSWKPNESFVDEQLKGPYSRWHHLHRFDRVPGGCLLRDEITYRVPGSFLGLVLLGAWISKDVKQIFDFRQSRIEELLATPETLVKIT